jgi:hypothetical protein
MNKTVYILGAGFSMDSGAPSQAKLLQAVFDLKKEYAKKQKSKVHDWLKKVETFLDEGLFIKKSEMTDYSLEDIYTPIDKSLLEATSFANTLQLN